MIWNEWQSGGIDTYGSDTSGAPQTMSLAESDDLRDIPGTRLGWLQYCST